MLLSWDFGIADAGCDPFTCDKIVVNPDIAFTERASRLDRTVRRKTTA
jgi:hypothetical protein